MEDDSRELLFAHTLEKVRKIAKEQGDYIRKDQVKEEFSGLNLDDSQIQMVFDYLEKHGIMEEDAQGKTEVSEKPQGKGKAAQAAATKESLTEEERNYLQAYLEEVAALPVYGKEELEAYMAAAIAGDTDARGHLTESFLKDVPDIAKLYVGQGVLLEDLIGEGNMALAMGLKMLEDRGQDKALKSFSEMQGMLVKQIMDAMETLIQENAANEKADRKVAERVNLVADKARKLAEELRRKVTPEELAQETELSLKAIQDAMRMSGYKIEDIAT